MSRKQKSVSLEIKQKILNEVQDGKLKKNEIASKYGIASSTISTILKNREKIEAAYAFNRFEPQRKRLRTGRNEDIEVALLRWIREARSQNLILTGAVLQEKAKFFADALGVADFLCSNGWLHRFKERHGIICKKVCGEESSVNPETVTSFFEDKWPAIIENYEPHNIFNADESGLFFKALPDRTLALKGEKCSGGKFSKERITVLLGCNMDGSEKLPLLVIGKSAKPRCFKRIKTLPVNYTSSKKAWMNKEIFSKWLKDLDYKFQKEKREVCLMLDNCSSHCEISGLQAIKCVFLPPNTTSRLQPCDQGIIRCTKMHYRKEIIKKIIRCFDNKAPFSIDLLEALVYLRRSWNSVTSETIKNCFRHGGFIHKKPINPENEQEPMNSLNERDELIQEAERRGLLTSVNFEEYIGLDEYVLTSDIMTDEEIAASVMEVDNDDSESEDEDLEAKSNDFRPNVSTNQATEALNVLQNFLMEQDNATCALNNLMDIENFLKCCSRQKMKQKTITDYFKQ